MYDFIIVGGGSAGSVMAHRLSARSSSKVRPVVPCANTNFPTLMAAEKIAEAMG